MKDPATGAGDLRPAAPAAGLEDGLEERLLVAVDLDGTLLDTEASERLHAREAAAIRAVRAAGHVVALCTGRNSLSVAPVLAGAGPDLADLPLILLNGAIVRGGEPRRQLACRVLEGPPLRRLVELFLAAGTLPMVYDVEERGAVLLHQAGEPNPVLARYLDRRAETVGAVRAEPDLLAALPESALEVGTIDRRETVRELAAAVTGELDGLVKVVNTDSLLAVGTHGWAEVYHAECGKGAGALLLAASLGIPAERIVAVGDNYNDLELFAVAGRSVAMGNAPAEVRAAAGEIAPPVAEHGAAVILERIAAAGRPRPGG